jgi:ACS family hexuronate transporter-like MFS transporter
MTWVEMALIAHLVLYLTEVLLFGVVAAGGLLAMAEVAGAVARPGGGLLSDRVFGGNRKKVFALMAGTTSIMCLIVGLFAPHLSWSLYPVLLILGMGSISFGGVWLTLLSEFGGRRGAGKAVGLGGMITLAGAAVGPPVFGYIVDTTGSYTGAWISLACGGAVCLLLLVFVRESRRRI